jgi:hypothetical protein
MSDLNEIAGRIVQALIPFLPYLLRIGDAAADEVGRRMGAAAWERARALWERLYPRRSVEPVAQAVLASPDNRALREALREEIARALAEDEALAQELARLLPQPRPTGQTVIASGDRSVAPGGDVIGSAIVTGDQNVVQQGKYNVSIGQASGVTIGDRSAPPQKSKGITMIPVESSMVDSVGYDEERRLLQVVFTSGRVYCYEDVPPEVFQGLLEAESKGQYMRAHIIDAYPYRHGPCRKT